MGLFNSSDMAKINAAAEKSKEALKPPEKAVSARTINKELNEMSQNVLDYFHDSPAILITSKSDLHDYVTKAIEAGYVGIDTETTGLDRVKDTIVGASLYYPGGVECYIPMRHIVPIFDEPYKNQLTYEDVGEEFQRFAEAGSKMIFANADYDLAMIYKDLRVDMCDICYYDVILAWRCLKENEPKNDLKSLYNKYVLKGKGDPKKFTDFFSVKLFPYSKPDVAKLYAANDAKITYELFRWQLPYITKGNKKCEKAKLGAIADLIWDVEFPLIKVCAMMHRNGIYVDKDTAVALNKRYDAMLKEEKEKLSNMVQEVLDNLDYVPKKKRAFTSGADFNPESSVQVKYLLYDLMKLPIGNEKQGTSKEVLHDINLPITNQILKVRSLGVLINTFVKKLPKATTSDSRIHAQMKQCGADCVTGDTIIATDSGYYRIDELCKFCEEIPGTYFDIDDVNILNEDQIVECASSTIMYKNYPTIKITTEFGITIEGTYNHPIMVSKYTAADRSTILHQNNYALLYQIWEGRYFKNLEDIQIGDLVEIPCNYSEHLTKEYQPTNLKLASGRSNVNAKMPEVLDEDFAEFLGMYHADGSHGIREGTFTVTLSNDDPEVYTHFDVLSEKLFGVPTCRYDKQRDINEVETYLNCYKLRELDKILTTGKRNKRMPRIIWKSPCSVINAYIRGMTLDSSVYIDGQTNRAIMQLTVMDLEDIRFIQMHLLSQGIACYVTSDSSLKDKYTVYHTLTFNADNYMRFRDTIGFIESKKYLITDGCKRNKYCYRRIDNSMYVKVKSIEYKTADVYDLVVPETHSFISNAMISHNTGRMSSAEPNLQNIPSHAVDIRHMFRATAARNEEIDCDCDDVMNITVEVSRYSRVYKMAYDSRILTPVHDLEEGDIVEILAGKDKIYVTLMSYEESLSNLENNILHFRLLGQENDFSEMRMDAKFKLPVQTSPYVMLSSDYSQQEPALTSTVSADPNMIKAFQEGKDIYATIASIAFGVPYEQCLEFHPETHEYQKEGKARRGEAKTIVLGICYGRSVVTIGDQLYGTDKTMTQEEKTAKAQKVYDSVLNAFPNLRKLMISSQKQAATVGYVQTILGRRRHIPDMMLPEFEFVAMPGYVNPDIDPLDPETLKNKSDIPERIVSQLKKEFAGYKYYGQIAKRTKELKEEKIKVINNRRKITDASRQCVNSIIQGSAADTTKMAILLVENDPEWRKLGGRLLVPVHDELVCEVPMENWKRAGDLLSSLMCKAADFMPFHIHCDVETSLRWYGLEYPCPYPKPNDIDTDEPDEVCWIQYHLFEMEYILPVYKDENGDEPRGNAAKGISGRVSEEYWAAISDYMIRYNINKDEFINHIEVKVRDGITLTVAQVASL